LLILLAGVGARPRQLKRSAASHSPSAHSGSMFFLFIILSLTVPSDWREDLCTGDRIVGRYVNYAEGFSVASRAT
jgi:hypothetical protein